MEVTQQPKESWRKQLDTLLWQNIDLRPREESHARPMSIGLADQLENFISQAISEAVAAERKRILETHTVKEPIVDCSWCRSQMPISADTPIVFHLYGCPNKNIPPSSSEKEEHKHRMEDTPLNSEYCLDCGVVFGKKEEVKEQPTTPETKVKISCPDCPHEETDTPEKKCCIYCNDNDDMGCRFTKCSCHQVKLPTSSYEVTCGRCEKSIKHSC